MIQQGIRDYGHDPIMAVMNRRAVYVVVVTWEPNYHDVIGPFSTVDDAEFFRSRALQHCADASISELQGFPTWEASVKREGI